MDTWEKRRDELFAWIKDKASILRADMEELNERVASERFNAELVSEHRVWLCFPLPEKGLDELDDIRRALWKCEDELVTRLVRAECVFRDCDIEASVDDDLHTFDGQLAVRASVTITLRETEAAR